MKHYCLIGTTTMT